MIKRAKRINLTKYNAKENKKNDNAVIRRKSNIIIIYDADKKKYL